MASDKTITYKPKHRYGWWLLVLVAGVFVFLSIRPVMRLKEKPPAEFMVMPEKWDPERRAREAPVIIAYWESARQFVQPKHSYGSPLPAGPPPEFNIEKADLPRGSSGKSIGTRMQYWNRLREVWMLPQSWNKTYEWSTHWVAQGLLDFQRAVIRVWEHILLDFKT